MSDASSQTVPTATRRRQRTKLTWSKNSNRIDAVLTAVYIATVAWVLYWMTVLQDYESLGLFAAVVVGCGMVFIPLSKVIGLAVGRTLARLAYPGAKHHPLTKQKTLRKWQDTWWQFMIHVSMTLLEWYVLHDEPWWDTTATNWLPHPKFQPIKTSTRVLYIVQLGIWVYTAFSHRFLEDRRKDYFVMYTHHIATIFLVAGSWLYGYQRIGVLVLWVHDVSDITVDTLKLANYLALEGPKGWFMSEIAFVINFLNWCYWRLYQFPTRCIYSSAVETFTAVAPPETQARTHWLEALLTGKDAVVEKAWAFNAALVLLQGMHIWWTFLFLRIAYKIIVASAHQAGEEEYEGHSDDDDEDTTTKKTT